MFKEQVNRLLNEFQIKKGALAECAGINRVTFDKRLKDNSFEEPEKIKIFAKYGKLL